MEAWVRDRIRQHILEDETWMAAARRAVTPDSDCMSILGSIALMERDVARMRELLARPS